MAGKTGRLALTMAALAVMAGAMAQDNTGAAATPAYVQPQWPSEAGLCVDKKGCICKKDLRKLPLTSPKGMSLISVCDYQARPDFRAGTFYFAGEAIVRGKLVSERRGGEEGAGDYVDFIREEHPEESSLFSGAIDYLQLSEAAPPQHVDYPELSGETDCWSADAVLRIKSLKVVCCDQDYAGSFPQKYEVVKVGKFSRCKPQ